MRSSSAVVQSWHGDWGRKADVLAQIARHREAGAFAPLRIDGREVNLYGWSERHRVDLDALRGALGIPVGLLAFGLQLFDGFPEDTDGIVDVITERGRFLEAVPVGRELSWVVDDLVARRLVDEAAGVIRLVDDVPIERLVRRTAECLRAGQLDDLPRADIRAELDEWEAEVPRQWQAEGKVDPRVHAHVRALRAADVAGEIAEDPRNAPRLFTVTCGGVAIPGDRCSLDTLADWLLEILADAAAT